MPDTESRSEIFRALLDRVFLELQLEPWFEKAENYIIEINDKDTPHDENEITLATTTRGGHMPTKITYYVLNIHHLTYDEIYRITKHEFAHLWGMHEKDAQMVEK